MPAPSPGLRCIESRYVIILPVIRRSHAPVLMPSRRVILASSRSPNEAWTQVDAYRISCEALSHDEQRDVEG